MFLTSILLSRVSSAEMVRNDRKGIGLRKKKEIDAVTWHLPDRV